MNLIFDVNDKPKFGQLIVFAIQELLAIMAATLVVPILINKETGSEMSPAAALFGAGVGTLVYIFFTKKKSPVFLGSSFAFLGSMPAAFTGAASMALGYLGLILGAVFAGLVYVIIAIVVKFAGVNWINKLMPAVVIGPTVSIIGLTLAGSAISSLQTAPAGGDSRLAILCGLVTLIVTMLCSTFGKKGLKLIPFIIGILAGYILAALFTLIGSLSGTDALLISKFSSITELFSDGIKLSSFVALPNFTFLEALGSFSELNGTYIGSVAVAYIPVAFVVFAEHIADHKNISTIIGKDLLEDPGLSRTLLGDGIGSMAGAFFGGCPNTTYGESVACVAITRNASVATTITAAIGAILISFLSPFVAFVNSIPDCCMGGICIALYGFIAVSGLKMIQQIDLGENKNLFVVSSILIAGIGELSINFGQVSITKVACALILGIVVNLILNCKCKKSEE